MANNENEGHNGAVISQIAAFAQASLSERPNVITLMAGYGIQMLFWVEIGD